MTTKARPHDGKVRILRRWILGITLVLCPIYIYWSWQPDPRFTLAKLQGLQPQEIIARFGPPVVDPRLPQFGGWTPNNNYGEPLKFYYSGGVFFDGKWNLRGLSYGVVFKDDHVVDVWVGEH